MHPRMTEALSRISMKPDGVGGIRQTDGKSFPMLSQCVCCAPYGIVTIGVDHDADFSVPELAERLGVLVRDVESLPHVAADDLTGEPFCDQCYLQTNAPKG